MDSYTKYIEELHNDSKQKQNNQISYSYKNTNHFANFISKSDKSEENKFLSKQPYTDEQFEKDLSKWLEESKKHQFPTDPENKLILEKVNGLLYKIKINKKFDSIITDAKIEFGKQSH